MSDLPKAHLHTITTVLDLARSLRSTISAGLPEGVKYMLVVTDYEGLGVDGTMPPEDMASACMQILGMGGDDDE